MKKLISLFWVVALSWANTGHAGLDNYQYQINKAKTDAISAAATDATTKANNAQAAAISSAATDATTKASNAQAAAISSAATDATTKANNAQAAAISTAATDATTKANNAQANAAQATATVNAVGSLILGRPKNAADYSAGSLIEGAILYTCNPANTTGTSDFANTVDPVLVNVGQWRNLTRCYGTGSTGYPCLWARYN